jgi:hypothetical protein
MFSWIKYRHFWHGNQGDPEYLGAAVPEASTQTARIETTVFDWAGETARRVGSLVVSTPASTYYPS